MKSIFPSQIEGEAAAPPSKSLMIRAAAGGLLAQGETVILNPSGCDDARAVLRVIESLGASITPVKKAVRIQGGLAPGASLITCGESGLCLRMMTPIAALTDGILTLTGGGTLRKRPMDMVIAPLKALGTYCITNDGYPPIRIRGPLQGGKVEVDGSLSSQFITGLLMALPLCLEDSEVIVSALNSRPYIDLTLAMLRRFGIEIESDMEYSRFRIPGRQSYQPMTYSVEGDWSGASFLLTAGALAGRVDVTGLALDSLQGDRRVLEALESAGAKVSATPERIRVEAAELKGFDFDATECPDLFPPLAALACGCQGRSTIRGVERLRHKESDRALAIVEELKKLGGKFRVTSSRMEITGTTLRGGEMDSRNDHRIAMAGAVAGLVAREGVAITNWQAVAKSYPGFFRDLKNLGGQVK